MNLFVRIFVAGVLSLAVSACGKTGEQKAQDNAQSLVDQYNTLAGEVKAAGLPNETWSDAQLESFENKVTQLISLRRDLDSANGDHNVVIVGGDSESDLELLRSYVGRVRASKKARQVADSKAIDEAEIASAVSAKVQRFNVLVTELNDLGVPKSSWSNVQLDAYERKLQEMDTLQRDLSVTETAGAVVIGLNPEPLQNLKKLLADARAEKSGVKVEREQSEAETAFEKFKIASQELVKMGEPAADWSPEMLNQYVAKSEAADKAANELSEKANIPSIQLTIQSYKRAAKSGRDSAKRYLSMKAA